MKIYIVCCVPPKIPYLRKMSLRCGPKCCHPIRLHNSLINYFSRTNWWNSLIFCKKFTEKKSWSNIFWMCMFKNECGLSDRGILKLTIWRMSRWNKLIFACRYRFPKIKSWSKSFGVDMAKDSCDQSRHGTLKLTISEEWTDKINWFCADWDRFTKIKS